MFVRCGDMECSSLLTSRLDGFFFFLSKFWIESVTFYCSCAFFFLALFLCVHVCVRNTFKQFHKMSVAFTGCLLTWLFFGAIVCLDSLSVISASIYLVVGSMVFAFWWKERERAKLVIGEYKKLRKSNSGQTKQLGKQKESLEKLREDKKTLEGDLEAEHTEKEKLADALKAKEKEIAALSRELEKQKERGNEFEGKYHELRKRRDEEVAQHDETAKEKDTKVTQAETDRDEYKSKVSRLEEDKRQLEDDLNKREEQEMELKEEIERLNFQVQRLEENKHDMEEKCAKQESDLTKLDDESAAQAVTEDCEPPQDWRVELLDSPDVTEDENVHTALEMILNIIRDGVDLVELLGEKKDSRLGPMKMTPLMYACLAGNEDAYYTLNGRVRSGLWDSHDNNILHLAVKSGNDVLVGTIARTFRSLQKDVNEDSMTPLALAAHLANVKMVEILVPRSWSTGDTLVETALRAVMCPTHTPIDDVGARVEIVNLVLEGAKDKSAALNVFDIHNGNTPLHLACFQNCPELVNALLEAGADPTTVNREGKKPQDCTTSDEVRACFAGTVQRPRHDSV